MKIVVVGGTGLIGSKLVQQLREQKQEIVAASPSSGVNSITGEGLANALKGASAVVDVTNSPSWEDAAVLWFFETLPLIHLVAEAPDGRLVGFIEAGLRSHADCCDASRPVGYIEGWYVEETFRRRGVGRLLMAAAEDWARTQGCREMASDSLIDNTVSEQAHRGLGYDVVGRCVLYRKQL